MDIKRLKKENQNIRELINKLEKNRRHIAMNIDLDYDYYSFLRGFDYVLDELKYQLNKKWRFQSKI